MLSQHGNVGILGCTTRRHEQQSRSLKFKDSLELNECIRNHDFEICNEICQQRKAKLYIARYVRGRRRDSGHLITQHLMTLESR